MSTASPLPLQPLPSSTVSPEDARALKQEIANRLAEHRQRRGGTSEFQATLPMEETHSPHRNRVADSVAARFARSVSYSEFLKQEAEAAIRQAEAAAEVARRNADAVVAAQQELLDEIDQWNQPAMQEAGPAEVIAFAAPADVAPTAHALPAEPEEPVLEVRDRIADAEASAAPVEAHADFAAVFTAAVNELQQRPATLAERLGLDTTPLGAAEPLPTNLIEFPRQLVATRKARPRLAEGPLRDEADASPERAQLRIFEVEASSVSTEPGVESVLPEWHTIRLDVEAAPRAAESPEAQISFALPLYVAPQSQRVMAFAVDACVVTAAFLASIAAAAYAAADLPSGLTAVMAAAGTLFLFAIGYQMLFFTLCGTTPGMAYARIGLCTFHDENPTRKAMRYRILALLLAGVPLGLGLLWACMDEERLGWHDRISRMYPRAY